MSYNNHHDPLSVGHHDPLSVGGKDVGYSCVLVTYRNGFKIVVLVNMECCLLLTRVNRRNLRMPQRGDTDAHYKVNHNAKFEN